MLTFHDVVPGTASDPWMPLQVRFSPLVGQVELSSPVQPILFGLLFGALFFEHFLATLDRLNLNPTLSAFSSFTTTSNHDTIS